MKSPPKWVYGPGIGLALLHVIVYFVVMAQHYEGSWSGFLIFLIDLPASLLILSLSNAFSIRTDIPLLIGGTAWWFCLGLLIGRVALFLLNVGRRNSSEGSIKA